MRSHMMEREGQNTSWVKGHQACDCYNSQKKKDGYITVIQVKDDPSTTQTVCF